MVDLRRNHHHSHDRNRQAATRFLLPHHRLPGSRSPKSHASFGSLGASMVSGEASRQNLARSGTDGVGALVTAIAAIVNVRPAGAGGLLGILSITPMAACRTSIPEGRVVAFRPIQFYDQSTIYRCQMITRAEISDFVELRSSVEANGFYARLKFTEEYSYRLTCVSDMTPDGRLGGTSFHVLRHPDAWYLVGMFDSCWRVPIASCIDLVCLAWLRSRSGPGAPPDQVVKMYNLDEYVAHEHLDRLFVDTYVPAKLRRIFTAQARHYATNRRYAAGLDQLRDFGFRDWFDIYDVSLQTDETTWRAAIIDEARGIRFEIDQNGDLRLELLKGSERDGSSVSG